MTNMYTSIYTQNLRDILNDATWLGSWFYKKKKESTVLWTVICFKHPINVAMLLFPSSSSTDLTVSSSFAQPCKRFRITASCLVSGCGDVKCSSRDFVLILLYVCSSWTVSTERGRSLFGQFYKGALHSGAMNGTLFSAWLLSYEVSSDDWNPTVCSL